MCGIAGQISADPNKIAANYPAYCRMQKSLARRGPDQRGIYLHGHAALIHARLAVVDLENGCQPMVLDQGGEKYILVYNGELYNTPELHAQLAALGHRFVSHSDTEVLLHAFAQWGPDCLEKLNGIFAFAVWQQRAQKLFLARDRIGVKPLFYALRGDSLIFASELKTLLCHPEIPPQVDAHGLADVLLLGPGRTPGCGVFRNVQELKPGCCAEYTVPQVGAPRLTVRRYWQLTDHEHPDDFTHTAAKVRDLVMDAVTRQLVSDVPVATFLSGGLDSSLISAIADSHFTARGKTLQTFSVGYQDNKKYFHATHFQPSPDAPYIRTMNQFLNAQHTWVTLDSEALAAALLEALDPEQNVAFKDHYLDIPFDLSDVLFITTANTTDTIPRPLLDRMDVIELSSYTRVEKFEIAKRHLLPKQLAATGLKGRVKLTNSALYGLIDGYTQEAGVRNLERAVTELLRKCAKRIAAGEVETLSVSDKNLEEILGPKRVKPAFLSRKDAVGVANGLAWTSVGGEILPIEVQTVPGGAGRLELTGSLGEVMKESAKLAITYAKAHAEAYGYDVSVFKDIDIHIHAPEGAIPKDGPSAGVTLTTALVSCLSGRPVRSDVAMTGEITLHGQVLPIGGLKEKSMAAYREGMKLVLIPKDNAPDLYEVDDAVKNGLTFRPVSTLEEVLRTVLLPAKKPAKAAKAPKAGGEKHTRPVPPEKAEPQLSIRQ